jgi:hypothetical protein
MISYKISDKEFKNIQRVYKGILAMAIQDALYEPNRLDEKYEKQFQEKRQQKINENELSEKKYQQRLLTEIEKKDKKVFLEKQKFEKRKLKKNKKQILKIESRHKSNLEKINKIFTRKVFRLKTTFNNKKIKLPVRPQNEIEFKRDALNWLYGIDKDDVWLLDLCCDISNVTREQVINVVENAHKNKTLDNIEKFFKE